MNKIETTRRVVDFMRSEHSGLNSPDAPIKYTPKFLGQKTGGYAATIGTAHPEICKELSSFGIRCEYHKGTKKYFLLWK